MKRWPLPKEQHDSAVKRLNADLSRQARNRRIRLFIIVFLAFCLLLIAGWVYVFWNFPLK